MDEILSGIRAELDALRRHFDALATHARLIEARAASLERDNMVLSAEIQRLRGQRAAGVRA